MRGMLRAFVDTPAQYTLSFFVLNQDEDTIEEAGRQCIE